MDKQIFNLDEVNKILKNGKVIDNMFEGWSEKEIDEYLDKMEELNRQYNYQSGMSAKAAEKIILTD